MEISGAFIFVGLRANVCLGQRIYKTHVIFETSLLYWGISRNRRIHLGNKTWHFAAKKWTTDKYYGTDEVLFPVFEQEQDLHLD